MDPITPVHGTADLLLIAAVAVAVLLFLIIGVRMHAFVALVLVSLATAVAAGIPLADVPGPAVGLRQHTGIGGPAGRASG